MTSFRRGPPRVLRGMYAYSWKILVVQLNLEINPNFLSICTIFPFKKFTLAGILSTSIDQTIAFTFVGTELYHSVGEPARAFQINSMTENPLDKTTWHFGKSLTYRYLVLQHCNLVIIEYGCSFVILFLFGIEFEIPKICKEWEPKESIRFLGELATQSRKPMLL